MRKVEQRAAALRILAKEPLTAEEEAVAEMLKKSPEEYVPPSETGVRVCGVCGAELEDGGGQTAMQKFVDHQASHNPSPAQWTQAHRQIVAKGKKDEEGSR